MVCLILHETFLLAIPFCTPVSNESFCYSVFLPTFGIVSVLKFDHCNRSAMVFHACFNLHFPENTIIQHLYMCLFASVIFGKTAVNIFGPFFNPIVYFLIF
jgi:hypothetical protein